MNICLGEYHGNRNNIRLFLKYATSKFKKEQQEVAYRVYVTDMLQLSPQNKYLTTRYADLLTPQKKDTRNADEIAADIIRKLKVE